MSRELDPTRGLGREIRRSVRRSIRDAERLLRRVAATPECDQERVDDPVDVVDAIHQVRRHGKEIRALLLLIGDDDTTRRIDHIVRDAGRHLSPVRDAHVTAELAVRTGATDPEELPSPWPLPTGHRVAIDASLAEWHRAAAVCRDVPTSGAHRAVHDGFLRTYRRSRRAFRRAMRRPSPRRLHRWRRWNKRLWYQVRFLQPVAPSVLGPLAELLDLVGETLGGIHDLDVFVADPERTLDEDRLEAIRQERDGLTERVLRWGATIHVERPSAFASRLVELWDVASAQGPEPAR